MITINPTTNFTFEEVKNQFGYFDKIFIKDNQEIISYFWFNMTGYKPNFDLQNSEGVYYSFKEGSKTYCLKTFKQAIKEGFVHMTKHEE